MQRLLTMARRAIGAMALGCAILAAPSGALGPAPAHAETSGQDLAAKIAVYRKKLAAYKKVRGDFDRRVAPYWHRISEKRAERRRKFANNRAVTLDDYVLEQPLLYTGPREPENPEEKKGKPKPIPDIADFLLNAKAQFGFTPETPATEADYKRAYARAATAAGLKKRECVKIYGFESGGNGTYDIQAGREYSRTARVISTALGYNQLLTTNSVELVAEAGEAFLATLRRKAERADGTRRAALEAKIAVLAKMIRFTRSVPDDWGAHGRLAGTEKGMGVHALILDVDVGPLLQTQKLLTSVLFARRKGYSTPLTAAELEMMNLTGDGNGFDMVQMPPAMREKVPTSNFFQQGGYERNPVAIRNNTVAKLLAATDAKMVKEATLAGAQELAAAFDGALAKASTTDP
jgi:hypothetical protein